VLVDRERSRFRILTVFMSVVALMITLIILLASSKLLQLVVTPRIATVLVQVVTVAGAGFVVELVEDYARHFSQSQEMKRKTALDSVKESEPDLFTVVENTIDSLISESGEGAANVK